MTVEALEGQPEDAADIQRMPIPEFVELGFLQEANRLFFHPLGLALEVLVEEDGTMQLSGVWDYRDDAEGMVFGGSSEVRAEKADSVEHERLHHLVARQLRYGWEDGIQPVESIVELQEGEAP